MRYYRIHTADIAYIITAERNFTAIGKLVDAGILSGGNCRILEDRAYFEKYCRCLPFMKSNRTRLSLGLKIL